MTDWTKTAGGTLMIRDTGDSVEFWFKARDNSDWANSLDFNWTANGSTTSRSIDYPTGADWYHVGSVTITTDQTVTFRLVSDTNISGIGGPTSFSHSINRATVPGKPSTPAISGVTATSATAKFTDGSNGGDAIDGRQLGYGQNTTTPTTIIASDGSTTITGLVPGRVYYFWARTHNSEGYGAWSPRASATTQRVPDAPGKPQLSSVTATSMDVSFTPNGNGGAPITAYQLGYGTSPITPTTIVSASSPQTITNLAPGTTYYVFARAQNSAGWSPWSAASSVMTNAGAYILVGTAWKLAVPYVNVGGVWKRAEPWACSVGVWNRTI